MFKKIKLTDIIFMAVVFVVVVALSITALVERHYRLNLTESIQTLNAQLEEAEKKNKIHETQDVNATAVKRLFSDAVGQVKIERVFCESSSDGTLRLRDSRGGLWSVRVSGNVDADHELLMIVDTGTQRDNKEDDTVIALYCKEDHEVVGSAWIGTDNE